MAFELHPSPPEVGETRHPPGVQRLDPHLARRIIPMMLERGILALRSAAWAGQTAPGDVEALADAMHNLPGFLARLDAAEGFDHCHFLSVTVVGLLRRSGPGSSDLIRRCTEAWMQVVAREYGQAVADDLRATTTRQGFLD